ncbi:MAG TPA: sulfite exporter TauE/SafE family protein [Usitatibacter sp.]|jgi:hypothetical protein|nr:sulfite exporter TauE/SafE family protein [Usitatibacter sp.]
MAATALLAVVAAVVGFFIGSVGVGGVLAIPALAILGGMDIHRASATALFTFIFTGVLGTWLFYVRGSIQWRLTVPICVGSVIFSYIGAMVNSYVEPRLLTLIIASIIVFAGLYVMLPSRRAEGVYRTGRGAAQQVLLASVGAAAGFGSGLSGAGGPVFAVPLMMALGFVPLEAIGASQVLQIVVAVSGTAGNLQFGSIDFLTAAWVAPLSLIGVALGTRAAHAVSMVVLRRMAAGLCIVVGLFMLVRAI